jgi:hypothetical protein
MAGRRRREQDLTEADKAMKRLVLMLYRVAAVVALLYPALSEARLSGNHNQTLL